MHTLYGWLDRSQKAFLSSSFVRCVLIQTKTHVPKLPFQLHSALRIHKRSSLAYLPSLRRPLAACQKAPPPPKENPTGLKRNLSKLRRKYSILQEQQEQTLTAITERCLPFKKKYNFNSGLSVHVAWNDVCAPGRVRGCVIIIRCWWTGAVRWAHSAGP